MAKKHLVENQANVPNNYMVFRRYINFSAKPGWPNQVRRLIEGRVSVPSALRVRIATTEIPSLALKNIGIFYKSHLFLNL